MTAEKVLPEPKTLVVTEVVSNKALIGKAFKKDAKAIANVLASLSEEQIQEVKDQLDKKGLVI